MSIAVSSTSRESAEAPNPYNRGVKPRPLSLDTPLEVERLQIEGWRRMSPADKAAMVTALTAAVIEMAKAGIRQRHPDESSEVHRMRLAEILHGPELARRMFPNMPPV
jgi:hypothetical protein